MWDCLLSMFGVDLLLIRGAGQLLSAPPKAQLRMGQAVLAAASCRSAVMGPRSKAIAK